MLVFRRSSARFLVAVLALAAIVSCGDDDPTPPDALTGTYAATTFQVTPDGQVSIDVLSHGGSLTLTLNRDKSVTGTLHIPANATGEEALTASMSGTVVASGNTVEFQQSADTFVRDLTWSIGTNTLFVANQRAGAGSSCEIRIRISGECSPITEFRTPPSLST